MPKIITVKGRIEPAEFEENEVFMWHPTLIGWTGTPHDNRRPGYGARPRWSEIEWSLTHKTLGFKLANFSSKEEAAGAAEDLAGLAWFRLTDAKEIEAAAKSDPNFKRAVRKILASWNALFLMGVEA